MKSPEQIQSEVRTFTESLVKEMRDHAIREGLVDENFDIKLRMANSTKQIRSRGGVRFNRQTGQANGWLSMKLGRFMFRNLHGEDGRDIQHIEYEHIENDPTIGTLGNVAWHKSLAALVAHEVAHAIDWYNRYAMGNRIALSPEAMNKVAPTGRLKPSDRDGHDGPWQYLYAKLRKAYVNNDAYLSVLNGKVAKVETKRKASKANKRFDVERINRNNVRWMIYRNPRTREVLGIVKATGNFLAFDSNGDYVGVFGRAVEARNFLLDRAGV